MSRWLQFLPFGLLVMLAGYFGWQMGKPMTETEIINFHANDYVKETGGALTDCVALPVDGPKGQLEIACMAEDGSGLRYIVGPRGQTIERQVLESVE